MLQCLQNTQMDTKIQKIQQDVSEINTLAKRAPIALNLLDRLHWQPQKNTQESKKVMPPQVGYSTPSRFTP